MNVSIVGSGYVGTTVAACLADQDHDVINVDIDPEIVETINAGEAPIHEPGLADRIASTAGSTLRATTDYDAVRETEVTLLCLPTPQRSDGHLGLEPIREATASLGETLAGSDRDHLVVVKSTVLPGTTEDVVGEILADRSGRSIGEDLHVAANPEFLRMGTAVEDFLEPDKVVVGVTEPAAAEPLEDLYAEILSREETAYVETGIREAELIKYANNAFLASKLSVVNELGNIAKEYGADAYEVLSAVGLDHRIEASYMRSGLGWGGSCFPKDVDALRAGARDVGYDPELLDAVVAVNDGQPIRLVDLLADHVELDGARIAVLGLSFKPNTDDIRKSRALDVIAELRDRGADTVGYDPVAMPRVRDYDPSLELADSAADALTDADGAVIATDWPTFDDLNFEPMARRIVVDGRRLDIDLSSLEAYEGLTW
ncbi:MAG: UDP-glucose/GDP-mannose dehydrogenase family protein [Natrialbaceae archaeon]|nr:UDP-glucose/GDP-mannose dehydrogenase family protein [Natrialbaceae archaeon]